MYFKGTPVYMHHRKVYGKDYPYSRFIEDFRAEKFNADEWADMFKNMGADFLLPVGEHHDGFKMYKSELSPFNSAEMGPHRDVLGELKAACEKNGLRFTTSTHFAERWFYYNGARFCGDNEITRGEKKELYGEASVPEGVPYAKLFRCPDQKHKPSKEWLEKWLVNTCEIIDRYQPEALWFDWWVSNRNFRPYMKKMAAYYYNRSLEWGKRVCIQSKFDSMPFGQGIFDRERGQLEDISPNVWQSETSTSFSSWCYVNGSRFKSTALLLCNFLDVVSKNGVFVLNFGPKSDGTFCEEEKKIAREMGEWLAVHGEIIKKASPYRIFGEGKKHKTGSFVETTKYCEQDLRFLYSKGKLYIFALVESKNNVYRVKSLADSRETSNYIYKSARVIGSDASVTLNETTKYLEITLSEKIRNDGLPICIELTVD